MKYLLLAISFLLCASCVQQRFVGQKLPTFFIDSYPYSGVLTSQHNRIPFTLQRISQDRYSFEGELQPLESTKVDHFTSVDFTLILMRSGIAVASFHVPEKYQAVSKNILLRNEFIFDGPFDGINYHYNTRWRR